MKYFVKWEVMDSLTESVIAETNEHFNKQIGLIRKSGKMVDGGLLLGIRGGYFIFDIKEPGELLHLLGPAMWDNCHITSFPIVSYDELSKYLASEYKKAA